MKRLFRMLQISSSLMGSHNSVDSVLLLCVMSLKIVRPSIVQWIMTSAMKMWTSSILHPTNQLISIVPINVHQFIVDSEIYGTVIMMHSPRRDEWMNEWLHNVEGIFMALHLLGWHVGAKNPRYLLDITFLLLFAWPLTNVCRNSQWWRFNDTTFDIFLRRIQIFCNAQLIFGPSWGWDDSSWLKTYLWSISRVSIFIIAFREDTKRESNVSSLEIYEFRAEIMKSSNMI